MSVKQLTHRYAVVFAAIGLASCSVDLMGTGASKDLRILEAKPTREVSPSCASMNLKSAEVDVPTFRAITACLDNNGSMPRVRALVDQLSDQQLAPITDFLNQEILTQPNVLHQLDRTFGHLAELKILDLAFGELGKILENDDFVVSALSLVRDASLKDGHVDPRILVAMEILSNELNQDRVQTGLNALLTLVQSSAFDSAVKRINTPVEGGRTLREVTDGLVAYLNDPSVQLGQEALSNIESGTLLRVLENLAGKTSSELQAHVPELSSVLNMSFRDKASLYRELSAVFSSLNGPMSCMKGAIEIPNAMEFAIRQQLERLHTNGKDDALRFLQRDAWVYMKSLDSFCNLPPVLAASYPSVVALSESVAGYPMVEMLDRFDQGGLLPFLIRALATRGSDGQGGMMHLLPAMEEANRRRLFEDSLLITSLIPSESLPSVMEAAHVLIQPRVRLGGSSLFDVLNETVMRSHPEHVHAFARSLDRYLKDQRPLLKSALPVLRTAFFMNNVHPVVDFARSALAKATRYEKLIQVSLEIAHQPAFADAIQEASELAQGGQLRDIFATLLNVFRDFGVRGADPSVVIHLQDIPAFNPNEWRRHNLARDDLDWSERPVPRPVNAACRNLDFTIPLSRMGEHQYGSDSYAQYRQYVSCLNESGSDPGFESALMQLVQIRGNFEGVEDASLLDVGSGLISALGNHLTLGFDPVDNTRISELVDAWIRNFDRSKDALKFMQTWFNRDWGDRGRAGPPFLPLLRALRPIVLQSLEFGAIERFAADLLRHPDAPLVVRHGWDIIKRVDDDASIRPPATPIDQDEFTGARKTEIAKWVDRYECSIPNRVSTQSRVEQIIHDQKYSVNNWELESSAPLTVDADSAAGELNARPRKVEYSLKEVKDFFQPMLNRFADPLAQVARISPSEPAALIEANLRLLNYFTKQQGAPVERDRHFSPEELYDWAHRKSLDVRGILLFQDYLAGYDEQGKPIYKKEKTPRVRLANSLDRFELVTIAGDIAYLFPENFGVGLLSAVGEAWGDEPWEVMPAAIQAKYPASRDSIACYGPKDRPLAQPASPQCAPRLRDAYNRIKLTIETFSYALGSPTLPRCGGYQQEAMTLGSVLVGSPDQMEYEFRAYQYNKPNLFRLLSLVPNISRVVGGSQNFLRTLLKKNFKMLANAPHEVKAGLFNSLQTMSVVEDNLPDRILPDGRTVPAFEKNTVGEMVPVIGMKIMRNIFFEMLFTTPNESMNSVAAQKNNIRVAIELVKFGILRRVGLALRTFPWEPAPWFDYPESTRLRLRREWQDFFSSFSRATLPREAIGLFKDIIGFCDPRVTSPCRPPENKLLWKIMGEVFSLSDAKKGKPPESQENLDLQEMKQTGFYMVSSLNQMLSDGVDVRAELFKALREVYNEPELREFLEKDCSPGQLGCIEFRGLLSSKMLSRGMRAMYEGEFEHDPRFNGANVRAKMGELVKWIVEYRSGHDHRVMLDAFKLVKALKSDASASKDWDLAVHRLDDMMNSPSYRSEKSRFGMDESMNLTVDFVVDDSLRKMKDGSDDPRQLRFFLADQLSSPVSSTQRLIHLASERPTELHELLKVFSTQAAVPQGGFERFLDFARQGLVH